jgi:hypothetical protein
MKGRKGESYQDRVARGAEARQKALDQLRSKAPPDPEAMAERRAAAEARDAAKAEKKAAGKAAREQAAADAKQAAEASAAEIEAAAPVPEPTEDERKAARDARYAARKSRR